MSKSFLIPFQLSGGRIATTSDSTTILEQKITDVLATNKMERVADPAYGAGINGFLFEDIDSLVEADLKTDIGMELTNRVTGASIVDVAVTTDPLNPTTAYISVLYRTAVSPINTFTFQATSTLLTEDSPF